MKTIITTVGDLINVLERHAELKEEVARAERIAGHEPMDWKNRAARDAEKALDEFRGVEIRIGTP